MTRKEAMRQTDQQNRLMGLGFTADEADQLRRISMTLHRWHERECGTDSACLVRGRWNHENQTFEYDDHGFAFEEYANGSGRRRYHRVPDREQGALQRLRRIISDRNQRVITATPEPDTIQGCVDNAINLSVRPYIQADPRGAALYLLRPGDVPEGEDAGSYYTRGIVVY